MDTIARLIDRREPVSSLTPCQDVLRIFHEEPHLPALAVLNPDHALGLIYRDVFIGMMQVAGDTLAQRPVSEVMDRAPRCIDAALDSHSFVNDLAAGQRSVFRSSFIAVDADGGYVGIGGLGALIASHRGNKREAAEAMALVDRMADDISQHLDGVLSFTGRLEQQRLTPDAAACVRAISATSRDMNDILKRAMDLHRSATGGLTLTTAPHRLRDLSDAVEARWGGRTAEGGSTLMFSYDGDPDTTALIDADRMLQVFDALIESALSSGRGVIEASLQSRIVDGALQLQGRVRDNTAGPPEDRLARVIAPLGAALHEDRSELSLGVSMALAHRLTQTMGGQLRAEANRGAGLTMSFTLTAPIAWITEAPAESLSTGRAAHILIVDDNATNRMVAEALCDMFDCTSEQVVDGVEAVEAARNGRFDLILMDIKMPRMDGVAATRAIRDLTGPAGAAPIVALTANADPSDVESYLMAGMQDVVEKPIKPERLAAVLNALLGGEQVAAA